jgi:hypothetical protein
VAFPLAPLLAFLSNLVEQHTDFAHLIKARRPPAVVRYVCYALHFLLKQCSNGPCLDRSTIGAWQWCFEFLSFASVFTNCFLLAQVSSHVNAITPASVHEHLKSDWGRCVRALRFVVRYTIG